MSNKPVAVILAGGEGKRMKSSKPKVLCEVLFKPMLKWVLDAVKKSGIDDICVVTGFQSEMVKEFIAGLPYKVNTVYQSERLGTGHAVMTAKDFLTEHTQSDVLILNGDAPFIDSDTITLSHNYHINNNMDCTVISAQIENPKGYGRIIRTGDNFLEFIVEEKEATEEQRLINEVNSGVYWFKGISLINALNKIKPSEKTGEYYLTDTVEIIKKDNGIVGAFKTQNSDSVLGANDCIQLNQLCEIVRTKILREHMSNGVNIPCTDGVIIGSDVKIQNMTTIFPSSVLLGNTNVGKGCIIGPSVLIDNCSISDGKSVNIVAIKNQNI